jgi:hypothetical protein
MTDKAINEILASKPIKDINNLRKIVGEEALKYLTT